MIGLAGVVHMTMADLAVFGNDHLIGEQGRSALLTAATYQHLRQPFLNNYASGWVQHDRDWAGGRMFWHNGSNTLWYALLLVLPEKNTVLVFVTNDGDIQAADRAFGTLSKSIMSGAE